MSLVEAIARQLTPRGLEPWPDGRSILDGKRPVDQHIAMIISTLIAERDDYKKAVEGILGVVEKCTDAMANLERRLGKEPNEEKGI